MKRTYSKKELKYLKKNYGKLKTEDIISFLGISKSALFTKAMRMKLTKDRAWTKKEISIFKKYYPHHTNKFLIEKYFPNRNNSQLINMSVKLGISKTKEKGMKWYDKETMLEMLKDLSAKLGRTPLYTELIENNLPSDATYRRYFGGYKKACEMIGLYQNRSHFGNPVQKIISKNGEQCLSHVELLITNFLIDNNISYEKEKRYSDLSEDPKFNTKRMDWYIHSKNLVVEYFGMMGNKKYEKKVKDKLQLCKKNKLNLLPIYEKDLSIDFLRKNLL